MLDLLSILDTGKWGSAPIPQVGRGGESEEEAGPGAPRPGPALLHCPQAGPPSKANHHANKKGMVIQKRHVKSPPVGMHAFLVRYTNQLTIARAQGLFTH